MATPPAQPRPRPPRPLASARGRALTAVASTICVVSAGAAVMPAQAAVDPDKSVLVSKDDSIVLAEGFDVGEAVQVRLERNGIEIATSTGNAEDLLGDGVGMFEVNHAAAPTQCWDDPATPEILAGDHVFVVGEAGQVADVTVSDLEVTQGPTQTGPSSGTVKGVFLGSPLPDISELSVETRALAGGGGPRFRGFAPGESDGVDGTIAYDTGPDAVPGAFTATFTGFNSQQMERFLDSFEVAATHLLPTENEGTIAVLDAQAGSEDPGCPPAERRAVTKLTPSLITGANASTAVTAEGETAESEEVTLTVTDSEGTTKTVDATETGTSWTADLGPLATFAEGTITVSGAYGADALYGVPMTLQKDSTAPDAPTLSPGPRTFLDKQTVSLATNDSSADIFYTLDGSQPSKAKAKYVGPIQLTRTTRLRAIAMDGVENTSPESTGTFQRATASSAPRIGVASPGGRGRPITAVARWRAPLNTGGAAITQYQVTAERIANGRVVQRRFTTRKPNLRSAEMSLARGTWRFKVRAVNDAGASRYSAWSNRTVSR